MSAKLVGLHPLVAELATKLVTTAAERGWKIMLTQGFRSFEEQERLYAKGRTAPGEPCRHATEPRIRLVGECPQHPFGATVTKARGGKSWHELGRAVDVCFIDEAGRPSWAERWPWNELGVLGESLGLTWGYRAWGFDRPHFHLTMGQTLSEAKAEYEASHPRGRTPGVA